MRDKILVELSEDEVDALFNALKFSIDNGLLDDYDDTETLLSLLDKFQLME